MTYLTRRQIPTFKVGDLDAADKPVKCIRSNDPLEKAYTIMCKNEFSQLVVADTDRPLETAIKGTITYKSIADALISGKEKTILGCLDKTTPRVSLDDDIDIVINNLEKHDAVLVIGTNKHLSGIITAWDLSVEFASLVGPFKWIGEIELRIREQLKEKLGTEFILNFLGVSSDSDKEIEMLTLGDLIRVLQNTENWGKLQISFFDRNEFAQMLEEVRELRNRMMHFRDPLKEIEKKQLQKYCEVVRKI